MMEPRFDELLHVRARLSIVALLSKAEWVEFGFIREVVETTDSALSKHISALSAVGYVAVRKETSRGARRTYMQITSEGRRAFRQHVAALENIIATGRPSLLSSDDGPT